MESVALRFIGWLVTSRAVGKGSVDLGPAPHPLDDSSTVKMFSFHGGTETLNSTLTLPSTKLLSMQPMATGFSLMGFLHLDVARRRLPSLLDQRARVAKSALPHSLR
jgi:hypothetical protein